MGNSLRVQVWISSRFEDFTEHGFTEPNRCRNHDYLEKPLESFSKEWWKVSVFWCEKKNSFLSIACELMRSFVFAQNQLFWGKSINLNHPGTLFGQPGTCPGFSCLFWHWFYSWIPFLKPTKLCWVHLCSTVQSAFYMHSVRSLFILSLCVTLCE